MAYDRKIKKKAQELRAEGMTYSEIMKLLNVALPKSTISQWCQNVTLPAWYQEKIDQINIKSFNKAQKMAWASNKIRRERLLKNLLEKNNDLLNELQDNKVLKMLLAILYLGEGSKWQSHRGLMLGNTNPDIIKLYIRLLRLCYDINPKQLKCRISYRADQDINKLQKYWSRLTHIPLNNFYKTIPDPRTIGKPTRHKNYRGVCVISCGGTHIQLELETIPKLILKGL